MNQKIPIKDYIFVTVQMLIFIAYFLPIRWFDLILPEWLHYSGLLVMGVFVLIGVTAVLQLNTKLSPFPSPVQYGKLLDKGVFRISRHPIYTALVFSGLGYAFYLSSIYKITISVLLFILFYYKSVYEERLLSQKFPEYQDYKKRTRRFI